MIYQPVEILRQFTEPFNSKNPVRCFVRFHKGGHYDWVSFWERSRNYRELHSERSDCPRKWEKIEARENGIVDIELYVVQRLKVLDLELSAESKLKPELKPNRYFFTCFTQAIYRHNQSGDIRSISIHHDSNQKIECYYPQNIIFYKDDSNLQYPQASLTCFYPSKVLINEDLLQPTPDIITFDNLQANRDIMISYREKLLDQYSNESSENLQVTDIGAVAEIYNNHLNESFFNKFVKNERERNDFPFTHVKYASLEEDLESFIKNINENRGVRLKFTSFTDGDWRIVLRQIAEKMGKLFELLIKQFTDFGQVGHDFRGYFARCFVRNRWGSVNESFWERSRSKYQLEEEREDYSEEWKEDEVLKKPLHAESYVLKRIKNEWNLRKKWSLDNAEKIFKSGTATSVYLSQKSGSITEYKTASLSMEYKTSNIGEEGRSATFFNPTNVKLKSDDGKIVKIDSAVSVSTIDKKEIDNDEIDNDDTLNVEIFINASPCETCLKELKDFVEKYDVFIHVKYSSFYYKSDRKKIDKINSNSSSNLKITPFTVEDWRIFNGALLDRIENDFRVSTEEFDDVVEAFRYMNI